jgi:hypothetical protein
MFKHFAETEPISIVVALFWTSAVSSTLCFATDRWLHKSLRHHGKLILVLLLLTVCWRLPVHGRFFHGLEYEDAYVYTVAGRQMFEHVGPIHESAEFPYSLSVCTIGALKSCESWQPIQEHLIGYPYVLCLLFRIAGYSPDIGSIANIVAACCACVLIFCISLLATDKVAIACAASLILAATPVFAVYGLETSAEPISNLCISLVLWFYVRSISDLRSSEKRWWSWCCWCAYSTALLFSLTVKRENIVLPIVCPIALLFIKNRLKDPCLKQPKPILLMILSSAFALVLSIQMRLTHTASGEEKLVNAFPLTVARVVVFFIEFARSFFVIRWYGATATFVILGIIVSVRRRSLSLAGVGLFLFYFILYAIHIRSYYEMLSGQIEPAAALRFSMNLMSLWALLAGIGIGTLFGLVQSSCFYRSHKTICAVSSLSVLAIVLFSSYEVNRDLSEDSVEDENHVRVAPALTAIGAAEAGQHADYVVTLEPLIIQMYGPTTMRIVDVASIDSGTLAGC